MSKKKKRNQTGAAIENIGEKVESSADTFKSKKRKKLTWVMVEQAETLIKTLKHGIPIFFFK